MELGRLMNGVVDTSSDAGCMSVDISDPSSDVYGRADTHGHMDGGTDGWTDRRDGRTGGRTTANSIW